MLPASSPISESSEQAVNPTIHKAILCSGPACVLRHRPLGFAEQVPPKKTCWCFLRTRQCSSSVLLSNGKHGPDHSSPVWSAHSLPKCCPVVKRLSAVKAHQMHTASQFVHVPSPAAISSDVSAHGKGSFAREQVE